MEIMSFSLVTRRRRCTIVSLFSNVRLDWPLFFSEYALLMVMAIWIKWMMKLEIENTKSAVVFTCSFLHLLMVRHWVTTDKYQRRLWLIQIQLLTISARRDFTSRACIKSLNVYSCVIIVAGIKLTASVHYFQNIWAGSSTKVNSRLRLYREVPY